MAIPLVPTTPAVGGSFGDPNLLNSGNNYGYPGYNADAWKQPTPVAQPASAGGSGMDIGSIGSLGLAGYAGYHALFGGAAPAAAATSAATTGTLVGAPAAATIGADTGAAALTGAGAAGASGAAAGAAGAEAAGAGAGLSSGMATGGAGLAGFVGGMAGKALTHEIFPNAGTGGNIAGGALGGAATGAMIGSVVPGIGTLFGGIVGGISGAISGMFKDGGAVGPRAGTLPHRGAMRALTHRNASAKDRMALHMAGQQIGSLLRQGIATGQIPVPQQHMLGAPPMAPGAPQMGPPMAAALSRTAAMMPPQRMAFAGRISGPGTGQSDSVPIMASNGEHMIEAPVVSAIGGGSTEAGHRVLEQFRARVRSMPPGRAVGTLPAMKR